MESAISEKFKDVVWRLKTLAVNGVRIPIKGDAFVEFKTDDTFVYHLAYLAIPKLDFGPCWTTSKGVLISKESSFSGEKVERKGRVFCTAGSSTELDLFEKASIKDDVLTLTRTSSKGIVFTSLFEKDVGPKKLDHDVLGKLVDGKNRINLNPSADSSIEDANENDNLTLLLTECDLVKGEVNQFYKSEMLGEGRIVKMDYYVPGVTSWSNGKFTSVETAGSCGAPGYRSLLVNDLQSARVSNNLDTLYGCGGTCSYTLINETHDDKSYTSISLSWECINVGVNSLVDPSLFGNVIDKHIGKASCPK